MCPDVKSEITRITELDAPSEIDVDLGYDTLDEYFGGQQKYFGCLVGRVGNRIAGGAFTVPEKDRLVKVRTPNGTESSHADVDGNYCTLQC